MMGIPLLNGVMIVYILYLPQVFGQIDLSKQCRPRSDATLIVIHPLIFVDYSTDSKVDLLKPGSISQSVACLTADPSLAKLTFVEIDHEIIYTSTIYYLMLCLKTAGWVADSVVPD